MTTAAPPEKIASGAYMIAQGRQLSAFLSKSGESKFVLPEELPELIRHSGTWRELKHCRVACNCCGQMANYVLRSYSLDFCWDCVAKARLANKLAAHLEG